MEPSEVSVHERAKRQTCIRFHGQLNNDLSTPAANLVWSVTVHATRSPSCSPPAPSDQFRLERAFAFVNLRLIVDSRSQLRICHDQRLSVSNPKEWKPTSIHRLSELKVLIVNFHTSFTLSTLRTPSRTTTNTYYNRQKTIVYAKFYFRDREMCDKRLEILPNAVVELGT